METRRLGSTELEVGAIGLGTEYLVEASRETVVSVVHEAVERGVSYFDVLFAFEHYQEKFRAAFEGLRDRIIITGHLGSGETDGQYRKTRDASESEQLFHDLLGRLHTDHVDVVFLSNCDEDEDYEQMVRPGGLLELAVRFQREGKARYIGFSGHHVPVSLKALQSGAFDVLMHTVNLSGDTTEGRRGFYHLCAAQGVGLVGMKPFAGGVLLRQDESPSVTPVQCLSYTLSQPGLSTVVPGVANMDELRATLAYLDAPAEEKDFSAVLPQFQEGLEGTCVYCNHCLPCPAGIDVAKTMRLVVSARYGVSDSLRAEYEALPAGASECTECGSCMERCPFKVDVIPKMKQAVWLFENSP